MAKGWVESFMVLVCFGTVVICSEITKLENFHPPARLLLPLPNGYYRQINNAGPPDPYRKSRAALTNPQLSIAEPLYEGILDDIKAGLQYIFQTRNEYTFAVVGTGTTGCDLALDNLIDDGDTVLALSIGFWGDFMANVSRRLGANVVHYLKEPGQQYSLQEVEHAVRRHRPHILAMVMGESDTTVGQHIAGIGDITTKYGALFVLDVVAAAGMQPMFVDKYKIDVAFSSASKGIGGVVGLAPFTFSERAVKKVMNRRTLPRSYHTDLIHIAEEWNTANPNRLKHQTPSLSLLYALREALSTIAEERAENAFKRHAEATAQLSRGLQNLGLKFYVENPKDRMIGITALYPPPGKDPAKIYYYMFSHFKVEISTGYGATLGKVLRIATFGSNADPTKVNNVLTALTLALNSPETDI